MSGTSVWAIISVLIAILAVFATIYAGPLTNRYQHRKTVVGIKQDIRQIVHPEMLETPAVVFTSGAREFRYENLYIIQARFQNRTRKSHSEFDVNVSFHKKTATVIFAYCRGNGEAHKANIKPEINFWSPANAITIDFNPFNWDDYYDLTIYVSCASYQDIKVHDIRYDSKVFHKFRDESNF